MKVAVFYDFLQTIGGGEKVALTLAKHLGADLITTDADPDLAARAGFPGVTVIDLGRLRRRPPMKQLDATTKFGRGRFPGYDFHIIVGNWAVYAAKHHRPNLYYCLTPTRMFFDQRDAVLGRLRPGTRTLARPWIRVHRSMDKRAVSHCDRIVAISGVVQRRVREYYGRDAAIVYPPVDTSRFRFERVGDAWLAVSRLYPEKRIDLLLDIFRRLPDEKLVVAGGHAQGDLAERYVAGLRPPPNVTLLGEVAEDALLSLYATCRGLIAIATDEDFGLTPVEAMAAGKCVIAADEGGYRETVVEGRTGYLLRPTAEAFATRIQSLDDSTLRAMRHDCVAQARKFDESVFLQKIRALVVGVDTVKTEGTASRALWRNPPS